MLQQQLAQVDQQSTATPAAAAAGAGKDASVQGQSSSLRSTRSSVGASSRSQQQQQQRGTLTSKLLHHQSKLEQALTSGSAGAPTQAADAGARDAAAHGLAAGIESGGGAALMSNFAALATGGRQLTSAAASLRTDSGQQYDFQFLGSTP